MSHTLRAVAYALSLSLVACKGDAASTGGPAKPAGSAAEVAGSAARAGSAAKTGSAGPVGSPTATPPKCGMPSNPNQAKDLGRVTIKLDAEELCGNYWTAMGYADGQRVDHNALWYAEGPTPTLETSASSMPREGGQQRFAMLPKDKVVAISLNHAHKFNEREYVDVTIELSGFTVADWDGKPLTAEVTKDGMGFALTQPDARSKRQAFVLLRSQRGDVREEAFGQSGTVTFEAYDLAKQAFRGRYSAKVAPIAGLGSGAARTLEGTFDVRLFD